jgi:hypothetical protein
MAHRFPQRSLHALAAGLLCCAGLARAQEDTLRYDQRDTTHAVNTTRLAFVAGGAVVIMGAVHVYQTNGWWKNNRRSFHFREDYQYALHVDKIGHFYAANLFTFLLNKAFIWANYDEPSSLYLGAGLSTLLQTYVELEDGFSTWGFDRVDFAADVAGAWYPVAQYHLPALRNFNLKFSYIPSKNINAPGVFPGQKHLLMDDYEGQTFWLSVNVDALLPGPIEPYWPDFLDAAVGYGARNLLMGSPYHEVFIALDYDMTKIIPRSTGFLRALGDALNFVHFPAPAVRISPTTVWYGLYF